MVNVILAFPKADDGKAIRNILLNHGIETSAVCTTGAHAIRTAEHFQEGLIICGYRFVDMYFYQLAEDLPENFEMLLLASGRHRDEISEMDVAYLGMPIKGQILADKVMILLETLERRQRKRWDKRPKGRTEEEKMIIRNAKYLLIQTRGMTEEEAHRYIQKNSMDYGRSMIETSQMILEFHR